MSNPNDPIDALSAANPIASYDLDAERLDQMVDRVIATPPRPVSMLRSWQVRAAAAVAVAAAIALPVTFALNGSSQGLPVLKLASLPASSSPAAAAAVPRASAIARVPVAFSGVEAPAPSYTFVAGPDLASAASSAGAYDIIGPSDSAAASTDVLAVATALGVTDPVAEAPAATALPLWHVSGSNGTLFASELGTTVPFNTPVHKVLPVGPVTADTGGGDSDSGNDPAPSTTSIASPSSSSLVSEGTLGAPLIPLSWTYLSSIAACAIPGPAEPDALAPVACPMTGTTSGDDVSEGRAIAWATPIANTLEASVGVSGALSFGTPTYIADTTTVVYPIEVADGGAELPLWSSDGQPTSLTLHFGNDGHLLAATGLIASTTLIDDYPLVSASADVASLTSTDEVTAVSAGVGGLSTGGPSTTLPSDQTSTSEVNPGGPMISPPATTQVNPGGVMEVTPPSTTTPAVVTETLDSALLGYVLTSLVNGASILAPAYTYTAEDGSTWQAVALQPSDYTTPTTTSTIPVTTVPTSTIPVTTVPASTTTTTSTIEVTTTTSPPTTTSIEPVGATTTTSVPAIPVPVLPSAS